MALYDTLFSQSSTRKAPYEWPPSDPRSKADSTHIHKGKYIRGEITFGDKSRVGRGVAMGDDSQMGSAPGKHLIKVHFKESVLAPSFIKCTFVGPDKEKLLDDVIDLVIQEAAVNLFRNQFKSVPCVTQMAFVHVYVDMSANIDMAKSVVSWMAKVDYPAACNAMGKNNSCASGCGVHSGGLNVAYC
ncbi:hypothetical protein NC651_019111 [Populus alba x Populus x berolinensis]|nr:hypothetical protein NC651_019111 [Populus alba x Populus x berolinensis]